MSCALPGIASGIGIDPTLPRDGTDFITLEGVIRIHVWLRLFCACVLREYRTWEMFTTKTSNWFSSLSKATVTAHAVSTSQLQNRKR